MTDCMLFLLHHVIIFAPQMLLSTVGCAGLDLYHIALEIKSQSSYKAMNFEPSHCAPDYQIIRWVMALAQC